VRTSSKRTRVGVVGVGYLGKFHADKYHALPEAELVGVVDSDPKRAENIAERCQTQAFERPEDLIGKVDAVSIVVPTQAHFDVGRLFLENDVDILIEKPMTTSLDQADALIQIAESRGLIIQVGHLERFNAAVVALQGIVKKPMFIESHRLGVFTPRAADVSVVLDLMIHDIDIISSFVRSEVKHIHAAGVPVITEHVDIANARLEFENGCVANVTASRVSMKQQRKIRMFQRDAYISVDFAGREITIVNRDPNSDAEGPIPGMAIQNMCFSSGDALEDEIKAFLHSVQKRQVPEVNGPVGREALKIALNIMDQIQRNTHKHLKSTGL
jgi:predicted dehydrogenase